MCWVFDCCPQNITREGPYRICTYLLDGQPGATASPVVTQAFDTALAFSLAFTLQSLLQALGDAGAALPPAATTFAGASVAAISATSGGAGCIEQLGL